MIEQFKLAKQNKDILFFENFQTPEISWENVLNFLFEESAKETNFLPESEEWEKWEKWGNIQVQDHLWLAPQTNYLFTKFKGVEDLLKKVNGGAVNKCCTYYAEERKCNCKNVWHSQGMRISLGRRIVSSHQDPHDILYWQILGSSYWKINNDKVYKLRPGDLFYFSKEDYHMVWCDEPRAGLIIDGIDLLSK